MIYFTHLPQGDGGSPLETSKPEGSGEVREKFVKEDIDHQSKRYQMSSEEWGFHLREEDSKEKASCYLIRLCRGFIKAGTEKLKSFSLEETESLTPEEILNLIWKNKNEWPLVFKEFLTNSDQVDATVRSVLKKFVVEKLRDGIKEGGFAYIEEAECSFIQCTFRGYFHLFEIEDLVQASLALEHFFPKDQTERLDEQFDKEGFTQARIDALYYDPPGLKKLTQAVLRKG